MMKSVETHQVLNHLVAIVTKVIHLYEIAINKRQL